MADRPANAATEQDATDDAADDAEHHSDRQSAFIDRIASKYDADDDAEARRADGDDADEDAGAEAEADDDDDDENDEGAGGTDDDDSDAEHTESGTSDDSPDGENAESDADSDDDDDEEHPEPDSDSTDDDDADADADDAEVDAKAEGDDENTDDDAIDAETKAALERNGANLKLEDVPEKYRPLVQSKLKNIDAAFSRTMQEATAFRKEQAELRAEKKFREENPALFIVEMLQKDDKLFDLVNERVAKLAEPDQAEAFKIITDKKRHDALTSVTNELSAAEKHQVRVGEVESYTRKIAASLGVPARLAEQAVATAIVLSKTGDITNEEIQKLVAEEAKAWKAETRKTRREDSRGRVRTRTADRRTASPAARTPAVAASPRPKVKPDEVDQNSEDSRLAAMERSAKRILSKKK